MGNIIFQGPILKDGGHWYPAALKRLGIGYRVVSGDIRNYIERWYETLKDRVRDFDTYFPHKKCFDTYSTGSMPLFSFIIAFEAFELRGRNTLHILQRGDAKLTAPKNEYE